ncbi:phenylalanine--tRNA ligase subunit beta [Wolbachia endosymbiont of Dirofilaria (Dirofilaria) immitis]|uniref:phenylalanine--tRNA ligase subunit beta n=1 Tax=Wolbachia endosymbiont of Dirofilaria (Dirofilaria) immitis TaxID=1812115 RepID=UPI001589AEFE|nr:phenylalanine--tRNA ligase subunit beta [Wolbachia endosymbiont of Dirofilaria (Dirofilaria) immitis]QKX02269.1 phenylalanine--tRNA ligase subunit beta [Wolbachia endosymbiont of Dirofilaria (Dirofilaria) immitis]
MKFTLSWLLEYLKTSASLEEITDKLTHIGLEVENVTNNNTKLAGVTTEKVLEVVSYPNTDKLRLRKTNDSSRVSQIAHGTKNIRESIRTVLTPSSSALPEDDFMAKPIKIQGLPSKEMSCFTSERASTQGEIEGIIKLSNDYKVGDKFFNYNPVIDINVTPNRGDCLSVYGIARDLAATGIGTLKALTRFDIIPAHNNEIQDKSQFPATLMKRNSSIHVKVTDGKSFISGTHIINVKNRESPNWLKDRLQSIGMRSISSIVDITNYIMISFGRPIHVYDAKKIEGELIVRKANSEEKFTDLNGKEYLLNKDISVIADSKNTHAIAGIIGGKYSECTLETTDIFLESSWFDPISITKSSRQLGISTDSSYRFARSVDPEFDVLSLATQMVLGLCGGEVSSVVSANGGLGKVNTKVDFDYQDVSKFGGVSASPDEIFNILTNLGFNIDKRTGSNWNVRVPSWRPDVSIPADLVEEVVRIYGYDKIKEEPLIGNTTVEISVQDSLRTLMASRGFHEVLTWSFMSKSTAEKFGYSDKLVTIDNPFNNNFNIMRPSIMPNLLQVTADNITHGIPDLAIFEIGPIYDSLNQPKHVLNEIRSGNNLPRNHYNSNRKVDIFDVKADLIMVLEFFGVNCDDLTIEKAEKEYYHPGKSGTFSFKGKIVGYFGELHPNILNFFGIKQKVVGFEVLLENISNLPISKKKFTDYKYQSVKRDFAFIVNRDIAAGNIINIIKKSSELIIEVSIFDIYYGDNIEPNKLSIALSVTFCSPTHTLTEEEIQKESDAIINLVYKNTGGVLRCS